MDNFEKAMLEEQILEEKVMKKAARPRGTDSAKVVTIIETKALVGRGTSDDPVKLITQYWDFDGNFLAQSE